MSDARLLEYLHGELSDAERADIDDRAARTPALAQRLRTLEQRSARLSSLLRTADPDPAAVQASARAIRPLVDRTIVTHPHWSRRAPRTLLAAAVITLLLGGALFVDPVRAWIVEQARAVAESVGLITRDPVTPAPAPAPAPEPDVSDVRFSFTWTAATFQVDAGAAAGTVIVTRGSAGRVTAEIGGARSTNFAVMPTGLRIDGAGGADATYTLTLPPAVTTVLLNRASGPAAYDAPAEGDVLRIPLQ